MPAKIISKAGVEGPRYDPYAYEELIIYHRTSDDMPERIITIHEGLVNYVKINDNDKVSFSTDEHEYGCMSSYVEGLLGVTLKTLHRISEKKSNPNKCPKCYSKKLQWFPGYPGETILVCMNCNNLVTSSFDKSAIE